MASQKEQELEKLKERILAMGGFVEDAIRKSIKALVERDRDLAIQVIDGDAIVNNFDVEIEEECIRFLAIWQPTGSNLRLVTTAIKIITDLERMGDLAVDICERSMELINYGGRGHSQVIHARDERVIMEFGLQKPVFRIVVNTFGTLGTTGYTTGLMPSMTLGSGGVGGAITGDNITVHHLYNVKKLAYETRVAPDAAFAPGSTDDPAQKRLFSGGSHSAPAAPSSNMDAQVEEIVRRVLLELKK